MPEQTSAHVQFAGCRYTRTRSSLTVPSCYTPGQVLRGLDSLAYMRAAVHYGGAVDAEDGERVGRGGFHNDGIRLELLAFMCDLDCAIADLPSKDGRGILRYLRECAELYWGQGCVQEAVAEQVGCDQGTVSRKLSIAAGKVVGRLCGVRR